MPDVVDTVLISNLQYVINHSRQVIHLQFVPTGKNINFIFLNIFYQKKCLPKLPELFIRRSECGVILQFVRLFVEVIERKISKNRPWNKYCLAYSRAKHQNRRPQRRNLKELFSFNVTNLLMYYFLYNIIQ